MSCCYASLSIHPPNQLYLSCSQKNRKKKLLKEKSASKIKNATEQSEIDEVFEEDSKNDLSIYRLGKAILSPYSRQTVALFNKTMCYSEHDQDRNWQENRALGWFGGFRLRSGSGRLVLRFERNRRLEIHERRYHWYPVFLTPIDIKLTRCLNCRCL